MLLSRGEAPHSGDVSELFSFYLFLLGCIIDETLLKSYLPLLQACAGMKYTSLLMLLPRYPADYRCMHFGFVTTRGQAVHKSSSVSIIWLDQDSERLKTGMFQKMYIKKRCLSVS